MDTQTEQLERALTELRALHAIAHDDPGMDSERVVSIAWQAVREARRQFTRKQNNRALDQVNAHMALAELA